MSDAPNSGSFSFGRVLLVAIPLAVIAWAASKYVSTFERDAQADLEKTMVSRLLGAQDQTSELAKDFVDEDQDLIADPPKKPADFIDPPEINFSYVASSDTEDEEATWKEFLAALGEKLGRKVNLVTYTDTDEQLRALKKGELHLTAFATGEVEGAVNQAGFVPLACFADEDGDYNYTMKIIVPADSTIEKPEQLKGQRMTYVRPHSNSGCTAALVMLMKEHNLQPERDYSWGFSFGHENSIKGVADKKFKAASVASDILERTIASGAVSADAIKTIYESQPYPQGVLGFAYNLKPELRDAVRETMLNFNWTGTGLEKTYGKSGGVKFAPVDYKKDWQGVRELNRTGSDLLAKLDAPAA